MLRKNVIAAITFTTTKFFPMLLQSIVFVVFIGFGNYLDLTTSTTLLILFNLIQEPLLNFPNFIG